MSEQNKAVAQRFYEEVVAQRKLELIDELIDENFVEHEEFPGLPPGREGVREFFGMILSAFPNMEFEVGDMIAEGDLVATRMTMSGTQEGEFMGMPATGKSMRVQAMEFLRLANGKVVEHWGVTDQAGMMEQLGVARDAPPSP